MKKIIVLKSFGLLCPWLIIITMKRVLFIILDFLMLLSCSRLPFLPDGQQGKKQTPVFEVFGYARCSNCPIAEHAVDSLKAILGDSVVVLEYHLRFLGDTISPAEIDLKTVLYGIGNSAPITIINGIHSINGAESTVDSMFGIYSSYYGPLREHPDTVGLKMDVNNEGGSVRITVTADSIFNADTEHSVIFMVLSEDSVSFYLAGAKDSIYNNVVRAVKVYNAKLPFEVSVPDELLKGKELVFMLQDTLTRNIISIAQRRF